MKRTITLLLAIGVVASVLTVGLCSMRRVSFVPTVHAQEGCSVASLEGAYGFFRAGTVPDGPLAAVGITTFDGRRASSTRQTIRRNGVTTSDLFADGAFDAFYAIDPDCTGRFINPDGSVFGHAVVVDGGREIFIISLSDHNTITGVMKQINSHRNHEED